MKELELYRNENGYIDLDKIEELWMEIQPSGKSESYWLSSDLFERTRILFKRPLSDIAKEASVDDEIPYELISSLVTCEIAKYLGIPTADYDIAIYMGAPGVITKEFLSTKDELIWAFKIVKRAKIIDPTRILKIKDMPFEDSYSIKNVKESFDLYLGDEEKSSRLYKEFLLNIYMMDFLTLEIDRNSKNWGLIYDGEDYSLAPRFDSDSIGKAFLGKHEVLGFIEEAKLEGCEKTIKRIYEDDRMCTLYSYENLPIEEDFQVFCRENLGFAKESFERIKMLDLIKIFENIENKIKQKIPDEYKLWVGLVINYQLEFMKKTIDKEEELINEQNSYFEMEEFGSWDSVQRG